MTHETDKDEANHACDEANRARQTWRAYEDALAKEKS